MRVRLVSREEVWASAGVQGGWVGGCGCDKGHYLKVRCLNLKTSTGLLLGAAQVSFRGLYLRSGRQRAKGTIKIISAQTAIAPNNKQPPEGSPLKRP